MGGGNSAQRRKTQRAMQRTVRERLWFILEHPLLASGVGAMLLTGIAIGISGWPTLAGVFYLAALLLLLVVFVRADLFQTNTKTAWCVLVISALFLLGLWVKVRPAPDEPHLAMRLDQAFINYDEEALGTEVFISVELRNTGSDSATKMWQARYQSSTLDMPIGLLRIIKQPLRIPLTDEPRGVVEYYNSDSIVEKTAQTAVKRGVPTFGRLPLWIPGDRLDELHSGKARIIVIAHDWQGKPFYGIYQSSGTTRNMQVLPGEKVAPAPASPTP